MAVTGVIVLAHGSRGERGKGEVEAVLKEIAVGLRPRLGSGIEIIGAALQFNQPGLEEAVALLSAKGINRIVIAPYFLFTGRHITEHVPQIMEKLQGDYPEKEFILADNLGLDESFVGLMARRIKQAAPDLVPLAAARLPGVIEPESLKIVAGLLPALPGLDDDELTVVKRIVHACGDPEVARFVRFSPSAVADGLGAIAGGSPIFTDVRMLMAGIDRRLAGVFGCAISCALDGRGRLADAGNTTRTAAAVRHLGARLDGAIVAIGNAPTALLALLDLIDNKKARPALVVGMPVGFVQAEASKQELMKRDVPYITVTGTRGGSAMAAAAVNSMLRIAADKYHIRRAKERRSLSTNIPPSLARGRGSGE